MIFFRTICALVMLSVCASGVYGMKPMSAAEEKQNAKLTQKEECIKEMKSWVDDNKDRLLNTTPEEYKHVEWSEVMFYGAYIVELNNQIDDIKTSFEKYAQNLETALEGLLKSKLYRERGYTGPADSKVVDAEVLGILDNFQLYYDKGLESALEEMKSLKKKAEICNEYIEGLCKFIVSVLQKGTLPGFMQREDCIVNYKRVIQESGVWLQKMDENIANLEKGF